MKVLGFYQKCVGSAVKCFSTSKIEGDLGHLTMKNLLTLSIFAGLASLSNAQGYFSDNFSSNSQLNYYGTDREAPQSVTTGTFFGKTAVKLTVWDDSAVTDPFYDFQGIQRYGDTAHTTGFGVQAAGSNISLDFYIPSSWNGTAGGTNDKRGGDLWARFDDTTMSVGNDAYPTVGFYNEGDGNGLGVETFDTYTGNINVFSLATLAGLGAGINLDGWNNVAMSFDGTTLSSFVNGKLIHTDSDTGWGNVATLEGGFIQGWRPLSSINTNNTYDVIATNMAVVPEPASFAVLGLGAFALIRRRPNKKA